MKDVLFGLVAGTALGAVAVAMIFACAGPPLVPEPAERKLLAMYVEFVQDEYGVAAGTGPCETLSRASHRRWQRRFSKFHFHGFDEHDNAVLDPSPVLVPGDEFRRWWREE